MLAPNLSQKLIKLTSHHGPSHLLAVSKTTLTAIRLAIHPHKGITRTRSAKMRIWRWHAGRWCGLSWWFGLVLLFCLVFFQAYPPKNPTGKALFWTDSHLSMAQLNIASGPTNPHPNPDFIQSIQLNGRFVLGNLSRLVVSTGSSGIVSINMWYHRKTNHSLQ